MDYSYTSLLTTVLFCNIVLIIISVIMSRTKRMLRVGYRMIVALILAVTVRLACPIEFLFMSHNIDLPDIVAKYITKINNPFFNTGLRIEDVLCLTWGVVAVIKLLLLIVDGVLFYLHVRRYSEDITWDEQVQEIVSKYKKKRWATLQVYKTSVVTSPLVCGVFHQAILLPDSIPYEEKDLEYVLCHEVTHYNQGDLYLKLLVAVIHCIFWWNPCTILIRNQLNTMLEIRVDDVVIQRTHEGEKYMTALLNSAKTEIRAAKIPIMAFSSTKSELRKRFEYMMERDRTPKHSKVLAVCMTILFILSYVFILEPDYINPKVLEEEDAFILTRDNAYLIDKGDGSYDVYYNGEYLYNETELIWGLEELEIINRQNEKNIVKRIFGW